MTPQQYDKMNGLNALGGCGALIILAVAFSITIVLTHSFLLACGAAIGGVVLETLWINKMKDNV